MPQKYINLPSFPTHNFNFHEPLKYKHLESLISISGPIYPNLVKDFFSNLSIGTGCVFYSKVKDKNIMLSLEEFGLFLDVSSEGQAIQHKFFLEWKGYSKVDYYFNISRLTQQDIPSKKIQASSHLILSRKNLSASDRMLHYVITYILMSKHSNHS